MLGGGAGRGRGGRAAAAPRSSEGARSAATKHPCPVSPGRLGSLHAPSSILHLQLPHACSSSPDQNHRNLSQRKKKSSQPPQTYAPAQHFTREPGAAWISGALNQWITRETVSSTTRATLQKGSVVVFTERARKSVSRAHECSSKGQSSIFCSIWLFFNTSLK